MYFSSLELRLVLGMLQVNQTQLECRMKLSRLGLKKTVAPVLSSLSHALAALLWGKQLQSLDLPCREEQVARG